MSRLLLQYQQHEILCQAAEPLVRRGMLKVEAEKIKGKWSVSESGRDVLTLGYINFMCLYRGSLDGICTMDLALSIHFHLHGFSSLMAFFPAS